MAKVYLNGEIIDDSEKALSVSETGFLYGAGLFETMRACNSVVFCLKDHYQRLAGSARELSLLFNYSLEQIESAVTELLKENNLKDARLRLTITNGPLNVETPEATILITASRYRPYPDTCYNKGISVVLSNYRQDAANPLTAHKTTSYFARLMALEQARKSHCSEALWFTVDNRLAEGSISNVFVVKDDVVFTPALDTPILPGIARKNIIALAGGMGIKVIEKNLFIHDLLEADEVFISNVIMKVMPVVNIEKHAVAEAKVGPVTKKLMAGFDKLIDEKCCGAKRNEN